MREPYFPAASIHLTQSVFFTDGYHEDSFLKGAVPYFIKKSIALFRRFVLTFWNPLISIAITLIVSVTASRREVCFCQEVTNLPNIKSAMKRVEIGEKNNLRNRSIKSGIKSVTKKLDAAVDAKSADAAAIMREAASTVDKAASKGVIHKNAANRKKAQLARKLSKAQ